MFGKRKEPCSAPWMMVCGKLPENAMSSVEITVIYFVKEDIRCITAK